ncbi:MAG: hypothetical protein VB018_13225 [Lachnospiraceae bacterium]|nr:hypothetical protein [Lachnospiraceae bacterium]
MYLKKKVTRNGIEYVVVVYKVARVLCTLWVDISIKKRFRYKRLDVIQVDETSMRKYRDDDDYLVKVIAQAFKQWDERAEQQKKENAKPLYLEKWDGKIN